MIEKLELAIDNKIEAHLCDIEDKINDIINYLNIKNPPIQTNRNHGSHMPSTMAPMYFPPTTIGTPEDLAELTDEEIKNSHANFLKQLTKGLDPEAEPEG